MDLSKLRQLTKENQQQKEKPVKSSDTTFSENTQLLIANIDRRVTEQACKGENTLLVMTVLACELTHPLREKIFASERCYSPSGLPTNARAVYDYCKTQGFKTRIFGRIGTGFSIVIVW